MASRETGPAAAPGSSQGGTLGTFAGVFTPSILTILGIILFLRMGYVVGSAGLGHALLIILFANIISVLTSMSLATIATNLRVKGGGDYYLISRTLGVEFGGALGLVLYVAQSVSIAFYAIGFGEGIANLFADAPEWTPQAVAAIAVAALFMMAWLGADVATKFQYIVMLILFAAITAFLAGGIWGWNTATLRQNLTGPGGTSFWVVFAIFFPAVTGFTQGVSMSGDLKDPSRSLPSGTFLAVGLSALIYFAVAVLFAANLPSDRLVSDTGAMRNVSSVSWLVDAGVIAATLSSALASFLGGPRILQSLARDKVIPVLTLFAKGAGATQNPRRAVLLSAVIAFATVGIGKLDLIAPIVSMFFLISYGLLNYATFFEARAKSPSFRPTFKWFDKRLSLLGGLACLGAMLAINPTAAIIAVATLFGVYQYLKRTVAVARWSDSSRSHLYQTVRDNLHKLSAQIEHARDWRPVLLAVSHQPERRERLIRFAAWIEGGAGFTTAVQLLEGEGAAIRKQRIELETELAGDIRRRELDAFALAVAAPDLVGGLSVLLQAYGVGPIRANTLLMNWFDQHPGPNDPPGLPSYGQYLRTAIRFGYNIVILDTSSDEMAVLEATPRPDRRIDVWYLDESSGQLMLLLAYLMTRGADFEDATIRVIAPTAKDADAAETRQRLVAMLSEFRINAEPHVVEELSEDQILQHSRSASIVFMPFRLRGEEPQSIFENSLDELLEQLPLTALVLASQQIDLDAAPEEGPHQELAEARDAAEAAQAKAVKAQRELAKAQALAEEAQVKLEAARDKADEPSVWQQLQTDAATALEQLEDLKRRAAKAAAKAEQAAREAEAPPTIEKANEKEKELDSESP